MNAKTCDCPDPDLCIKLGRHMNQHLLTLWNGTGANAEAFRTKVIAQAPSPEEAAKAKQNAQYCAFLWKRVRREGKIVKRTCKTCGNGAVELDLFTCRCPARANADGSFDQVTLNDCRVCTHKTAQDCAAQIAQYCAEPKVKTRALILKNYLSPGDVLVMTAAVYSLHKAHPGRFLTGVDTSCPHLWENNPDVATKEQLDAAGGGEVVQTDYNHGVQHCNQHGSHFMAAYCHMLGHALQVPVPLATNRPMLYLSEDEKSWMNQVEEATGRKQRFVLMCAGRKNDFTAKFWGSENFQRVVDLLRGKVLFVQVGNLEHHHPPLKNVLNFVGKTDLRQLIRLCYHAEGVVCGVTFLHHLAAAMNKPCVTLLGGREPVQWNTYPRCQLLHTGGAPSQCAKLLNLELGHACWRSRTAKLNDGAEQEQNLCADPVHGEEPIPRCLSTIRPETVAEAILDHCQG